MTVRTVKIGDVMTQVRRVTEVEPGRSYPMVGARNFARGPFDAGAIQGGETAYKAFQLTRTGDFIYPKLGAWEGARAFVPADLSDRYVSPEYCVFELSSSEADGDFLRHLFAWELLWRKIASRSSGTNVRRQRLQPSNFLEGEIPLPPLSEQRRIAAHLDRIANVETAAKRSDERVSGHLAAVMRSRFAVLEEADKVPLGELLELQRRTVDVTAGETYTEIGVRSFGRGLFIKEPVTGAEIGNKRVFSIESGDLVVSNVFGWEGAVAVADDRHAGLIGSHRFMTWTPTAPVDVTFLAQYLLSERGIESLEDASPGAAGRNRTLSISNFKAIEVPNPQLRDQKQVAGLYQQIARIRAVLTCRSHAALALLPAARNEVFEALT